MSWPLVIDLLVPVAVILALSAPALFTRSGFVDDWVNHLWLAWLQSREIKAMGHPSLFLNAAPMGVFYPNFAFYGGTLYAIGGYLMVVTGAPMAVFVGMIVLAFASAYGGTFWIARQAGIRGLAAHLPATIVVTGAYYLSDAYGRGSWPEFVATSAIPLVVAGALRIVRHGSSPGSLLVLASATTIWSGSHNLTFAWGGIFLLAVSTCLLLAWGAQLTELHVRRICVVLVAMGLGVMINGWFLLPDLSYSLHTQIAQYRTIDPAISGIFSRSSVVFNPFRERATDSTYLRSHFTELPVLVFVWLAVAVAMLQITTWSRALRRLFVLLTIVLIGFVALLLDEQAWHRLPSVLSVIQFTFRLEAYIVMALAGLTIVVLRAMRNLALQRCQFWLMVSLGSVVLLGLGLATWQVWNSDAWYYPYSPKYLANRSSVLRYPYRTPPTWYETGQFRDVSDQVVPTEGEVQLDPAAVRGESTTQNVTIPAGEGPLSSNIAASANLVSVSGLRIAGRTASGFLALERPENGSRFVRLSVSRANTTPMTVGPLLTLFGALGLIASMLASFILRRRRHH